MTTSAASPERRKRLESMGVRVEMMERKDGRVSLQGVVELLAREKYLSLMIEAGSKVNWSVLESGVADKIFFYYAPKILGGMHSLPVAGGVGRRRRNDAIRVARRAPALDRRGRVRGGGVVGEEPVADGALRVSSETAPPGGEILTIYGFGAGPSYTSGFTLDASRNVATSLNGAQVLFDGNPAPMMYGSALPGQRHCALGCDAGRDGADHSLGWRGAIARRGDHRG